jgi:hypothetical protein
VKNISLLFCDKIAITYPYLISFKADCWEGEIKRTKKVTAQAESLTIKCLSGAGILPAYLSEF